MSVAVPRARSEGVGGLAAAAAGSGSEVEAGSLRGAGRWGRGEGAWATRAGQLDPVLDPVLSPSHRTSHRTSHSAVRATSRSISRRHARAASRARRIFAPLLALLAGVTLGCSGEPAPATDAGSPAADAGPGARLPDVVGPAARPAALIAAADHEPSTPAPLLVLLHGYGATGDAQDLYLGLSRQTTRRGWLLVVPDGTVDASGRQFWNATPACCDFGGAGVDDVGYLTALLDEVEGLAAVSQVFFMGHSNGGFMSYRMACERSGRITAVVSLAGSDFDEASDCVPDAPVSVLQIHGEQDETIAYEGSEERGGWPSARAAVERWASRAGCDLAAAEGGTPLDLDRSIEGDETMVLRFRQGCDGTEAALWTIVGGAHLPALSRSFTPSVLDWLEARGR